MNRIIFTLLVTGLLSSCASRGMTLSQQMPGYDKELNPVSLSTGYKVDDEGNIAPLSEEKSQNSDPERLLASNENRTLASLDPKYGAYFIGKSSSVKKPVKVKKPAAAIESVLH